VKKRKELQKVDVVYVGFPGHVDVFIAYLVAKFFRKKLIFNPIFIVYVSLSDEMKMLKKKSLMGYVIMKCESLVYSLCDMVFADTPDQIKVFEKVFKISKEKLRVLPIGADNKGYVFSKYKNANGRKVNVVYYGLYSPIHGVNTIIDAANILKNNKDVSFTMIGYGVDYDSNYKRAQELGLKNITFYPDIREGKHLKLVQCADIFLGFLQKHPSVERIIPNKVYQGLALGRAVVTAESKVIRGVFTDRKNIYLCKPDNPKALVKAILHLKNNPKLRSEIAKNGYELYTQAFTPKVVGKKFSGYVSELVKSKNTGKAMVN
jgi:glycosyltransferase involved in cell wall biosynthesis